MADMTREAEDYENEISDLHNRLDIAEYDKERLREEVTTLETENKRLTEGIEKVKAEIDAKDMYDYNGGCPDFGESRGWELAKRMAEETINKYLGE